MKAIGYLSPQTIDQPKALIDFELPLPTATGRDILVKVEAVSVNPVDTKIRKGLPPEGDLPKVLGWDASGSVEAIGDDVTLFQPGQKVWYAGAINRSGSNAEYHLVDERIVGSMPTSLNFTEAAAMPLTSITAWEMLFDRFKFGQDSKGTLLIIGAAGGVGSIMIQLAKALTQLTVITSASRDSTVQWVRSLGADYVINHRHSMVEQLHDLGFEYVDSIASLTHTDQHFDAIVEMIAPQGRLGVIDDAETLDIMPLKTKSVSTHWELMFTRSLFQTKDMIKQHKLLNQMAQMVDSGNIQSTLSKQFGTISANNLIKAHALIESGKSQGKIVLTGFE